MLMTEPPWSYPVTCNPAGINIPQSRQGTMQAYWPCIPLCVFLEAQQIIPLTAKVIHHLWPTPFCHPAPVS